MNHIKTPSCPSSCLPAHASVEPFCASGSSPTVHLVGAGAVGRAFLRRLEQCPAACLVAVTDRSGTVFAESGLDPARIAAHKAQGTPLLAIPGAAAVGAATAIAAVEADIVVDAASSDPAEVPAALARARAALRCGAQLVLAAKAAAAAEPHELLVQHGERVGINALLGGTGARLQREADALRRDCVAVTAVANASSTAVLTELERGCALADALERARARGLLEPDPSLDLDGTDAASKIAVVAGLLWQRTAPLSIAPAIDFAAVDGAQLARRAARGRTTRLVARVDRDGSAAVELVGLDRRDVLAVPPDRVAYVYEDAAGGQRVHIGLGLGPDGTAEALLEDVSARCAVAGGRR